MLDGMMEQHAEQGVDHVANLLLFAALWMDVGHRNEPLLPHGHLEHGASVLPIAVAQQGHILQEQLLHIDQGLGLLGLPNQGGHHLEDHWMGKENDIINKGK